MKTTNKGPKVLNPEQLSNETEQSSTHGNLSNLSLKVYGEMKDESRSKIHNRVRQWSLKVRQAMPKDYRLFCLILSHLLKNAHRYFQMEKPSELQMKLFHDRCVAHNNREHLLEECKEVNKKVREIRELKNKNRLVEQEQLVSELKQNYHTFRNMSHMSGIPLKSVHSWCSRPKDRIHKTSQLAEMRKKEFEQFLLQDTISFTHPSKKLSKKRFLRDTLAVTRQKYLQQTEFHQNGVLSFTCMKKYRPPYIMLCNQTPLDQCLCDRCENVELLLKAMHAIGIQNIPGNRYAAMEAVVCSERCSQFGTDFSFPEKSCIYGNCENCGEESLGNIIRSANEELFQSNRSITWRKWVTKSGKSSPEKCQIRGTVRQALQELLHLLNMFKPHLFRANWNRNIFQYSRNNLQSGHVVQIFDFAQNFTNIYQDQVQSAYWQSTQTTIHALINYYKCQNQGCSEVTTLILAQISEDPLHDSFVARAGHDAAFRYLAETGVPMDVIMQFCDNCSSQYKSRRPFAELARCPLNVIRVYFGEKHGKSQCDGFFGRLKSWMTYKIKARQFVIMNADDFFISCRNEYQTPAPVPGECQHYKVAFQYLRPSDIRRHHDCDLDRAVPGTLSTYSVRNTPDPLKLKIRTTPCLCPPCIADNGEQCKNHKFTDGWKEVDLIPVKGDSKKKHMKRKHPMEYVSVQRNQQRIVADDENE